MNTFFEKLTKPQSHKTDIDLSLKKEPQPMTKNTTAEEEKSTKLKVASEETSEIEEREDDEEGELTVDIFDEGESIIIQSTLAGVKPEDIDVTITSDSVTIRGKREQEKEVDEKNYFYKELFWGKFSRSIILPEEIDEDAAEATLKHGLLSIRLPKKKKGTVQKLKVKMA